MKRVFELLRLNQFVYQAKKWMRGKGNDDEDIFNHPFAIF